MLNDKKLIPLCQTWARRFMRQGRHLGAEDDVFDELTNVAYEACKGLEKMDGLSTWIMWTLINYTKIPNMADQREKESTIALPTDEICEKREDFRKVHVAISRLSDEERAMVYLRFRDGMGYTKIGRMMGYSRTWIRTMIEHALKKIRKEMG